MKYKINSRRTLTSQGKRIFKARRTHSYLLDVLPPQLSRIRESIDLDSLFELASLPEAPRAKRKKRAPLRAVARSLGRMGSACKSSFCALAARLRSRSCGKPAHTAFYAGVLCSISAVALFCSVTVICSLFLGYFAPYRTLSVPDTVGIPISDVEAHLGEQYELLISYKNSDEVDAGVIISQIPAAGVTRKAYKNRPKSTMALTVSMGKKYYTVEDFRGKNARDVMLALRNSSVAFNTAEEFSDTVPRGAVISTSPSVGEMLFEGKSLAIKVSLGKQTHTVSVPNLYGLNEAQARSMLAMRSLSLGTITYAQSSLGAGKIISQSAAAYSSVAKGSTVDVTVSIGTMSQRFVPDLYAHTLDDARIILEKAGLVVGNVYTVSSAAPSGTVIMQSPAPGTAITSSINTVDLYISSQ
jgi:beta-lactam-binding protein with PASTA domain